MHKIDTPGNQNGQFVDKNPAQNIPGTIVDDEWLNAVQGELVKIIEASGIALSKDERDQLYKAIIRTNGLVVSTYAEARAFNTAALQDGQSAYWAGRAAFGDGGEGHFIWHASDLSHSVADDQVSAGQGDGGIYVAPDGDTTGASGAWVRQSVNAIDARWYGVVADGITDDAPALQALVNAVESHLDRGTWDKVLIRLGGGLTFKTNSSINVSRGNITIDATGATIDATEITGPQVPNDPDAVFIVTGGERGSATITADVAAYGTTVEVDSVSGLQAGDPVRIYSSGETWYTFSGTTVARTTINRIQSISDTTVTLHFPVPFGFDSTNYTVTVEAWDALANFRITGGSWFGGGYREPLSNGVGPGMVACRYVANPIVEHFYAEGFQNTAVRFERAMSPQVRNGVIRGLAADYDDPIVEGTNSGFYGVFFVYSRGCLLSESTGYRCRHFQDVASSEGIRVVACHSYGSHRPPYGSHQAATNMVVDGCGSIADTGGVQWRGFNLTVVNCTFLSPHVDASGIYDYQGAAGDMPRDYVFSNNRCDQARHCIRVDGNVRSARISGNKLRSNDPLYGAIVLGSLNLESAIITNNSIGTVNGAQAIEAPNSTPNYRSMILVEANRISGYTDQAVRVYDTGGGVVVVKNNYLDAASGGASHVAVGSDAYLAVTGPNFLKDGTIVGVDLTRDQTVTGHLEVNVTSPGDPAEDGYIRFERVDYTTLRVKLRGGDGVVRSTDLTLS